MTKKLSVEDINNLTSAEFQELFKNAVELWPQAAISVTSKRPFANLNELLDHFDQYLDNIDVQTKIAILRSHPDLAGKLADENNLSVESTNEQASAGLNKLTPQLTSQLVELNAQYRAKFDFPFVICVRQNNKFEKILEGVSARLSNRRDDEVTIGIGEVKKICKIRIGDIVNL